MGRAVERRRGHRHDASARALFQVHKARAKQDISNAIDFRVVTRLARHDCHPLRAGQVPMEVQR
eukprot:2226743-Pyramimonas_sp.AAC.1